MTTNDRAMRLRLSAETIRELSPVEMRLMAGATGPCPSETCAPLTVGGPCYTLLQLGCLLATGNPCK